MSRRRGEFEHRTSIFEGAFRAWSHLGGLEPEDLETKAAADLDPLTNPIENDPRIASQKKSGEMKGSANPDGSMRREYPYEPLPRSGLAHPYVQAILSPWLGPDADNEAIQLGLTTLRTWWQHRRKGESGSAVAALGTEKMKGVVEGYTRHFFTLAHCLIVNDREQPPRTLFGKMKDLEKMRSKRTKKRAREDEASKLHASIETSTSTVTSSTSTDPVAAAVQDNLTDSNLTPLERLHAAQRRQLAEHGGIQGPGMSTDITAQPFISLKGKCIPGKIDLPAVVSTVQHHASQLVHSGGNTPAAVVSSSGMAIQQQYGDPNMTPVVFVSGNGNIQIALKVEGITCAHCVKIVETVLKGCNGNKSPIEGLLDAAADRDLMSVLIRIDKASNAKRIAFEAARNLAMVGYTAKPKEMSIVGQDADKKATMDLGSLSTAFEVVANTEAQDFFEWTIPCTCPDNGVLREDCARHSQMNKRIFDAFEAREKQVTDYMAGCGMRYGMDCTCGPGCRCKNCPIHQTGRQEQAEVQFQDAAQNQFQIEVMPQPQMEVQPLVVEQPMDFFGMEPPSAMGPPAAVPAAAVAAPLFNEASMLEPIEHGDRAPPYRGSYRVSQRASQRNPSVISYGSGLRHMSITSETTFGRAMSGLSALSIDWENLEDFDLDVDHSAHITNSPGKASQEPSRRSSLRRSYVANNGNQDAHVTFRD